MEILFARWGIVTKSFLALSAAVNPDGKMRRITYSHSFVTIWAKFPLFRHRVFLNRFFNIVNLVSQVQNEIKVLFNDGFVAPKPFANKSAKTEKWNGDKPFVPFFNEQNHTVHALSFTAVWAKLSQGLASLAEHLFSFSLKDVNSEAL